ncbi:MAG TPA: tail fiber domain-containing protein [Chthoniobacterales bacterium]|jgi:hypothetical protein
MKTSRASAFGLAAALLLPSLAFAVQPPPGGGYPNNNTALGTDALFSLTTGLNNTALGYEVLYSNTYGAYNDAVGNMAMHDNTSGAENVAVGEQALTRNTTADGNVALGSGALASNTTGGSNVAVGDSTLLLNTIQFSNVAIGDNAMPFPAPGGENNVAIGRVALGNFPGPDNVAVGDAALNACTGKENIAVGPAAGLKITDGNHNIDIGSEGTATDHRIIRIGNPKTQRAAYFAAISGVTVADGVPVIINRLGQLGTVTSSARDKEKIQPMAAASEAVLALKPVTFRYKKELDSLGVPQFGLVAEQVAKVDPDLVARDESGKPYTVRYEAVNAMLLNEFLKEHRKVEAQEFRAHEQDRVSAAQTQTINELKKALVAQEAQIKALTSGLQKVNNALELVRTSAQVMANE